MEAQLVDMVNREQDEESGRFVAKHEDEDFLGALQEHGGAASTTEIAETVGANRRTTHYRLDKLRDQGRISSRKVGNSLLWIADDLK